MSSWLPVWPPRGCFSLQSRRPPDQELAWEGSCTKPWFDLPSLWPAARDLHPHLAGRPAAETLHKAHPGDVASRGRI